MVNDLKLVEIGAVRKAHGVNGQVRIKIKSEFNNTEIIENTNPLFIQNRGLFIPFYIEELQQTGKEYIVKLLFCDTLHHARELVECKVYVDEGSGQYVNTEKTNEESVVNYTVFSEKHGKIGLVSRINEIPGNPVLEVSHDNNIVMVPFVKEIVIDIDHENKLIKINPPDGLIEMYL